MTIGVVEQNPDSYQNQTAPGAPRDEAETERDAARRLDEIHQFLSDQYARREVVARTVTPLGQHLDWIPIESQLRAGQKIAEPPPGRLETTASYRERPAKFVRFELEDKKVARGPEGTVPVLRKNLKGIRFNQTLAKLLGKPLAQMIDEEKAAKHCAAPN